MLTFLTAFLGLIVGVVPVQLDVTGDIATVELRLDGSAVARLHGAPWTAAVDFGKALEPHELVAVGFDEDGRELTRQSRWINLPQPRSRAELILVNGGRAARLVWQSADGTDPDGWRFLFDGEAIDVEDPSYFELPDYDAGLPHLLQAHVLFGRSYARAERIVGGRVGESVDTELTALAFFTNGGTPEIEDLRGQFFAGGEPLDVFSVERGGAEVIMVQDSTPASWGQLNRLRVNALRSRNRSFLSDRLSRGLNDDDHLRVILPLAERADGAAMEQFHISPDFGGPETRPTSMGATSQAVAAPRARGVLAALPYPPRGPLPDAVPRSTAEAVAVAVQAASASRRRRAVILVRDPQAPDQSAFPPSEARRYARLLHVPLLVWAPDGDERPPDGWGGRRDISSYPELQRAAIKLRQVIDEQIIVWVRGRHRPQDVELTLELRGKLRPAAALPFSDPPGGHESESDVPEADTSLVAEAPPAEASSSPHEAAPSRPAASQADSQLEIRGDTVLDRIEVGLVELQVVVTDGDGRRVRDLGREDFELLVDGEPVPIRHVEPPVGAARAAESTAGESADVSPSTRLVIFFDASRLAPRGRRELAASLRQVLAEAPPAEVLLMNYDRSLRVALPLTSDRRRIDEALARLERGELTRAPESDVRSAFADRIARVESALLGARDESEKRMAEMERNALLAELRQIGESLAAETRAVVDAMRRLSLGLGAISGRKVLLYLGDGLELSPAFELYDEAAETLQLEARELAALRSDMDALGLHRHFDQLLEVAHAAGVTFYSLTPKTRGSSNAAVRSKLSATRPGGPVRLPSVRQELVREAVCLLSGESGGLCQAGGSDPTLLLEEATRDFSAAYTLAFEPVNSDTAQKEHEGDAFHQVEVRLARPGLDARHRRGYAERSSETRIEERLSAALYLAIEDDELGVELERGAIEPMEASQLSLVPIELRVPVQRLGLEPLGDGEQFEADARFLVMTRHEDGTASGLNEYPIRFGVTAEQLQGQPIYAHEIRLLLGPGEQTIALGLWDETSRLGSFKVLEVTVPTAP